MNENKPLKIGYARVSTEDQELALQLQALEREGCDKVFTEKVSGSANSKQNQLEIALMNVRRGDTFIVWKLDRLGRDVVQRRAVQKPDGSGGHNHSARQVRVSDCGRTR